MGRNAYLLERSRLMASIRSRGNQSTELAMISIFRAYGIKGWRRNRKMLGRPDFVFEGKRVAVFADGCFWHACPKHKNEPATNRSYWSPKLAQNRKRDRDITRELRRRGWTVIRFWEHDLRNGKKVADRCRRILLRS
jgi:DNA mismatch endonuclease (patch repair protein)